MSNLSRIIIIKNSTQTVFKLFDLGVLPSFIKNTLAQDRQWNTEIVEVQRNRRIRWHSSSGEIETKGQVILNALDHDRTELVFKLESTADPAHQKLEEDLKRFKEIAENSEIFSSAIVPHLL